MSQLTPGASLLPASSLCTCRPSANEKTRRGGSSGTQLRSREGWCAGHFLRRRGTPACLIDVDFHKHNDLCNPSVQSDVDGLFHGCSGLGDSWSLARRAFDWSRMQHQFKASSFSYIWVAKSSRQRFADCTIRHSTSLPRGCSDQESYQALAPWLP